MLFLLHSLGEIASNGFSIQPANMGKIPPNMWCIWNGPKQNDLQTTALFRKRESDWPLLQVHSMFEHKVKSVSSFLSPVHWNEVVNVCSKTVSIQKLKSFRAPKLDLSSY